MRRLHIFQRTKSLIVAAAALISFSIVFESFYLPIKNSHKSQKWLTRTHIRIKFKQIRKHIWNFNNLCSFFYLLVNVCRSVRIVRVHFQVYAIECIARMPNATVSLWNHVRPLFKLCILLPSCRRMNGVWHQAPLHSINDDQMIERPVERTSDSRSTQLESINFRILIQSEFANELWLIN